MNNTNEMKVQIKETIKKLIEMGNLTEATQLLIQYEDIVSPDGESCSMKAIIAIMESRLSQAMEILKYGLSLEPNNADLLYNLAYVFEQMNQFTEAIFYYKKVVLAVSDDDLRNASETSINRIKEYDEYKQKISIIIVMRNNLQLNKLCIDNIRRYTEPSIYELIVVDNESQDGTREWLKQQPDIECICNEKELNLSECYNQGIEISNGNNVVLLSNIIIVTNNWLKNLLIVLLSSENIGVVGSLTNNYSNQDRVYQYNDLTELEEFASNNNISNSANWEECLELKSLCMLIKGELVEKIDLLNENFNEYILRIRKNGYKIILCKDAFVHQFLNVNQSDFLMNSSNDNVLWSVLKNIECNVDIETNSQFIYENFLNKKYNIENILEIVNKNIIRKVELLIILAEIASKACDVESELSLLNIAYQLEPKNTIVINKLIVILQQHNQLEKLLYILDSIDDNELNNELNAELIAFRENICAKIENDKNTVVIERILRPVSVFSRVDKFLHKKHQDPWYFENFQNKKILLKPPMEYIGILHNVIVVGGTRLIFDEKEYLYHDDLAVTYKIPDFRPRLIKHVKVLDEDKVALVFKKDERHKKIKQGILISSEYDFSYGHWMLECLPKILFVKEIIGLDKMPLLVGSDVHPYYLELISEICEDTKYSIVKLEKGYIYELEILIYPSDPSFIPEKDKLIADGEITLSSKWIKKLQEKLVGEREINDIMQHKKIYLTRRNFYTRKLLNELEIEIELEKKGFEIIDLTSYSHEERKKILGQAKLVIGALGSSDCNMLYCKPGTKLISLCSNAWREVDNGNGLTHQIFNIYKIVHKVIYGSRVYKTNDHNDDFTIPVEELLKCIDEIDIPKGNSYVL